MTCNIDNILTETEFMVTQSITSPVTSISQPGQHNHIPQNCGPMPPHMMTPMEGQQQPPAEKKKKVGIYMFVAFGSYSLEPIFMKVKYRKGYFHTIFICL